MERIERDYYFDNLKGVLILSVIVGNTLESISNDILNSHILVLILYLFHMPLFTFVSGYFAKKSRKSTKEKVVHIVKVYVVAQCIYSLFYAYINNITESKIKIFYPSWTLWYLLSLICWYVLIDYIENKKLWFIISALTSLLIGLDITVGPFGSVSRTIFFLPFFIAGYSMEKSWIDKIKKYKWPIIIASLAIIGLTVCFNEKIPVDALFEYSNYKTIGLTNKKGIILRAFHYVSAFIVGAGIMSIIFKKKSFLAFFGRNSLVMYLLHSGVVQVMLRIDDIQVTDSAKGKIFVIIVVIVVSLITFIYVKIIELLKKKSQNLKIN